MLNSCIRAGLKAFAIVIKKHPGTSIHPSLFWYPRYQHWARRSDCLLRG